MKQYYSRRGKGMDGWTGERRRGNWRPRNHLALGKGTYLIPFLPIYALVLRSGYGICISGLTKPLPFLNLRKVACLDLAPSQNRKKEKKKRGLRSGRKPWKKEGGKKWITRGSPPNPFFLQETLWHEWLFFFSWHIFFFSSSSSLLLPVHLLVFCCIFLFLFLNHYVHSSSWI